MSLEARLDELLPMAGNKCSLLDCTPGKVWLFFALLSIAGSVTHGWKTFVMTVLWEAMVGIGVSWLCRNCKYGWLWTFLIIFSIIPAVVWIGKGSCCSSSA